MSIRVSILELPSTATKCPISGCVYNVSGVCDDARINKRNGDSLCHKWTNKRVLEMLKTAQNCHKETEPSDTSHLSA